MPRVEWPPNAAEGKRLDLINRIYTLDRSWDEDESKSTIRDALLYLLERGPKVITDQTPESLAELRDQWRAQNRERKAKIIDVIFSLNELALQLQELSYDVPIGQLSKKLMNS